MGVRIRPALVVGVVLLVVLPFGAWRAVAARSMADVRIEPGAPTCSGVTVGVDRRDDRYRPQIPLRPAMACQIPYWVANPGSHDVVVTGLTYPLGGPGGGAAWKVVSVEYDDLDPASEVDAVWSGAQTVPAGTEAAIVVSIEFRARGCTDGGSMWVQPVFTVRSFGRHREVLSPASPTFRGTRESTCEM
ncbi:hypothetical protein E8D34_06065 [Nocardioides sp. GY 10113]|uniref:hypothetical protein n=1 Tax=Nocardioides sp. GY 10113 TaxID=2569761 RepID=UPI0010A94A3E|nr:hypothetical protein [Nocardioides sp. GY 10113]TIC88472.1 hypothetical protein E8D34_06065 [Nocardioides sp. GY 10113]